MVLGEGEPAAGPWRVERLTRFARFLVNAVGASMGRPPIVALDGRSSSGKTTLAHHLEQLIAGAVTVHTDDIAWWHSFFGWADLLASGVLEPIRRGQAVAFRPPAWDERGRTGAIELPVDASVVIVEGVGASRREIAHLLDAAVWVQSDLNAIERRNAARVAAGETKSVGPRAVDARGVPLCRRPATMGAGTRVRCRNARAAARSVHRSRARALAFAPLGRGHGHGHGRDADPRAS